MTVGMVTSWRERCGIAAYTEKLVAALGDKVEVRVIPPPRTQTEDAALEAVAAAGNACDVIHIQHEYTFFNGLLPRATTFFTILVRRINIAQNAVGIDVHIANAILVTVHDLAERAVFWQCHNFRPVTAVN